MIEQGEVRPPRRGTNGDANKLQPEDRPAHDWYRFVLSFPPHLVRDYLDRFGIGPRQQVLDPFCGTGTTLVEAKKASLPSVGIEANPMAHFASGVKVDWTPDPDGLIAHATSVANTARSVLDAQGITYTPQIRQARLLEPPADHYRTLTNEQNALILTDSISPLPLHKYPLQNSWIRLRRALRSAQLTMGSWLAAARGRRDSDTAARRASRPSH